MSNTNNITNDATVGQDKSTLAVIESPAAVVGTGAVTPPKVFPHNLPETLKIILGQNGIAYSVMGDDGNPYVLPVGSRKLNNVIREVARNAGFTVRKSDIAELNNYLQAHAETAGIVRNVWYRVAPIEGGIEIELGDEKRTRVQIASGKVAISTEGSKTLFYRTQVSQSMAMPAAEGNLKLMKRYVNLDDVSFLLFTAWLSYTLAHPKVPANKFLILALQGHQGSGKTFLCYLITKLIDPSLLVVQVLPGNAKDLAVAAQNAHVLCYDNIREIKHSMADLLCVAATGGAMSARQLYTDSDQQVIRLHAALVLNGLHSFIDQPDLAQRTLPLKLKDLPASSRESEAKLISDFHVDLPVILRGLLDLIAKVFIYLPTAEVTDPERMYDFVKWLAGMESAHGVAPGVYQGVYSAALNQGQLDSLMENVLAAAIMEFALDRVKVAWTGTPSELLNLLNAQATRSTQRSREWPQNTIALSKRLVSLQAGLLTQGISVELSRGKERGITVKSGGKKQD